MSVQSLRSISCLFLLLTSTGPITSLAQEGDKKPARLRYAEVYKKYEAAKCPIPQDEIKHFVYFARDREAIIDHPFLKSERFVGAQIMYSWRRLEPRENQYDFSEVRDDLRYLTSKGKRLFIQLQDATFSSKYPAAPRYLLGEKFGGGQAPQVTENGKQNGWVCKRWNPSVQERFAALLRALGQEFDGKIEGINLQETAIDLGKKAKAECPPEKYVESIKANMLALKRAFPTSVTMQYANFMPGEWLPGDDKGHLKSIYEYGEKIGVGLGSPDLMIKRLAQLNHPFAMMHEKTFRVPLGIAIQDGNYTGTTGADFSPGQTNTSETTERVRERKNPVPMLHAFAKDFLHVNYIFWVNQEPYFAEQVLPCIDQGRDRSQP